MLTIEKSFGIGDAFKTYPYCRYAVEVNLQKTNRQTGNIDEYKMY